MVNTNSKAFRDKVQAHIRTQMRGRGGVSAMFAQMEYLMKSRNPTTAYGAAKKMVEGGDFLVYNDDIRNQLHRWGLTNDRKLDAYKGASGGVFGVYTVLMAGNMEKMHRASKKGLKGKN